MKNKRSMKGSEDWFSFLKKLKKNRFKLSDDEDTRNFCDLPDLIVKYFKSNNDKYLELCKMEDKDGTK